MDLRMHLLTREHRSPNTSELVMVIENLLTWFVLVMFHFTLPVHARREERL